jgi:hypothetical protein
LKQAQHRIPPENGFAPQSTQFVFCPACASNTTPEAFFGVTRCNSPSPDRFNCP